MLSKLYALLTDLYVTDSPIYIFRDRATAEQALTITGAEGGAIVPFLSPDLMAGAATGLVYLAMSMEDSGLRIHAAFRSMFGLRSFLDEQVTETTCIAGMGWLDPDLENGQPVERFRLRGEHADGPAV